MNKQNTIIDIVSMSISLIAMLAILLILVYQPVDEVFPDKSCAIDQLIIYLNHNSY